MRDYEANRLGREAPRESQVDIASLWVSGKVVLEDGTPPPESVTIERTCGGGMIPVGTTDSKGRFTFPLGVNSSMEADSNAGRGDMDRLDSWRLLSVPNSCQMLWGPRSA